MAQTYCETGYSQIAANDHHQYRYILNNRSNFTEIRLFVHARLRIRRLSTNIGEFPQRASHQ